MKPIYLTDNFGKQKMIGKLIDHTFVKEVDKEKHFMRLVKGYGIQQEALAVLRDNDCDKITIVEKSYTDDGDKISIYSIGLEDWIKNAKVADYGFGKQSFLSLSFMNEETDNEKA